MHSSTAAYDLGKVIMHDQTIELSVTDKQLPGAGKGQSEYTYAPGLIGNKNVRVMVSESYVSKDDQFLRHSLFGRDKFTPGAAIQPLTTGISTWHGLGHAWAMIQFNRGAQDVKANTAKEAIRWENRMREQTYGPLGPSNASREKH